LPGRQTQGDPPAYENITLKTKAMLDA